MTRQTVTLTISLIAVACAAGVWMAVGPQPRSASAEKVAAIPIRQAHTLQIGYGPLFLVDYLPADQEQLFQTFNQAQIVFAATVSDAAAGLGNPSLPPIHNLQLTFTEVQVLRGSVPRGRVFHYSKRQHEAPRFFRRTVLVAASRYSSSGPPRIAWMLEANPQNRLLVSAALALPSGWTQGAGRPISPWAKLGANTWLQHKPVAEPALAPVCSVSGRPAFLAGSAIKLQVTAVAPPVRKPVDNPQGDGQFKVTVTNTGAEMAEVPALRTDGKQIFWADSLYVLSEWEPYLLPGARMREKTQAVRLAPGARVSTVVNVLAVQGIPWLGSGPSEDWGHDLYFQFCLGELSCTHGFYYSHTHHGRLREREKALRAGPAKGVAAAVAE